MSSSKKLPSLQEYTNVSGFYLPQPGHACLKFLHTDITIDGVIKALDEYLEIEAILVLMHRDTTEYNSVDGYVNYAIIGKPKFELTIVYDKKALGSRVNVFINDDTHVFLNTEALASPRFDCIGSDRIAFDADNSLAAIQRDFAKLKEQGTLYIVPCSILSYITQFTSRSIDDIFKQAADSPEWHVNLWRLVYLNPLL